MPRRRFFERPREREERERAEEDEEAVRACFLRVPDEQRAHGGERCDDHAYPVGHERAGGRVADGNRERSEERRQGAQPGLVDARHA